MQFHKTGSKHLENEKKERSQRKLSHLPSDNSIASSYMLSQAERVTRAEILSLKIVDSNLSFAPANGDGNRPIPSDVARF